MTRPTCPQCGAVQPTQAERDGRATHWRIRIRLYDATRADEPRADSDPELPADRSGSQVLHGLPAVAAELRHAAELYHGETIGDLSEAKLLHRLKSLRPTLSRNAGKAAWRVPYVTVNAKAWLARVDVLREGEAEA